MDLNIFIEKLKNWENLIASSANFQHFQQLTVSENNVLDDIQHLYYIYENLRNNTYNIINDGHLLSKQHNAILLNMSEEEINFKIQKFNELRSIISPPQRSPEWFEMRNTCISASDTGCVLELNKYEEPYNFLIKKVFGSDFKTNDACYFGKKFETACVLNYEYLNDAHLEDFGLLKHNTIPFLGASPDSIVSLYCRDMKTLTPLVGRMIEIKCLKTRKLNLTGNIYDEICPSYYYSQVQMQLECCDLNECDFIQYKIYEYDTREDFIADTHPECHFKSLKFGLEKSVLIEVLPAELPEECYTNGIIHMNTIYDKATHIYPPRIDMSLNEMNEWILYEIDKIKLNEKIRINRIVYYAITARNCTLILRDKNWFNKQFPYLQQMWDRVLFLRENPEKAIEWKNIVENSNDTPKSKNNKVLEELDKMRSVEKIAKIKKPRKTKK